MSLLIPHQVQDLERVYWRKVASVRRDALVGLWPLWELSGTVAKDLSPLASDGTYDDTMLADQTFKDGRPYPSFVDANDEVDIYSAALAAAFDGTAGTVLLHFHITDSAVWTDGSQRLAFSLRGDGDQFIVQKTAANNAYNMAHICSGTTKFVQETSVTTTDPIALVGTWSEADDELKAFKNGAQLGSTQTGLGAWTAALNVNLCVIGAASNFGSSPFVGAIARVAVWNVALSAGMVNWLSQVP
ncbi:MAG: LamG domain-containing protein [Shimia sp.]|nr:LamG domain-containing protein [Shimia sp.]